MLQRIRDLISAHVNAAIDAAEDPELMANQCLRDAEDMYGKFQVEYNKAVADQLLAQQHLGQVRAEVQKWADYADKAVAQGRDDLAREALIKKHEAEGRIPDLEAAVAQHDKNVADLKQTGQQLREHIEQLRAKRDDVLARHHAAQAKRAAGEVARQLDPEALSATMHRIGEKVSREEAEAGAALETARQVTADPFEELDQKARQDAVEAELAALKAKRAQAGQG